MKQNPRPISIQLCSCKARKKALVLWWKFLKSTEKDSCLLQGPELNIKYAFGIFLLTLLIKANLKTDSGLLQPFLKHLESELNHFGLGVWG